MLYAVTADLQFDEHVRFSTMTPGGITSRLQDMLRCWEWITEKASERKAKGIIVIGDIFDSRTVIDLSVLDSVCRAFHKSAERGLELHIVVGNHDSYLRSPRMNSLQVFRGYATVWERPGVYGKLGFVPWTEDGESFQSGIDTVITGGATSLFTHVMVKGSVAQSNTGVPLEWLKAGKFGQVFLGDIHDPREIAKNVRYVGSPLQINYGDAGGRRGFYFYDTAGHKTEYMENTVSPKFHVLQDVQGIDAVGPSDFVRVKGDDPAIAQEVLDAVKGRSEWVESTVVEVPDVKPRLDVRSNHTHEDVLRRYCAHHGIEECDALVAVGLEIIEEAKGV